MASSWMSCFVSLLIVAVYASLRVPGVNAARVPDADGRQCVRDIDCTIKHLPKCKGLFVCADGKCVCIPGKTPPPKANAEPPLKQCVHDNDCDFDLGGRCSTAYKCDNGKCYCLPAPGFPVPPPNEGK